jgi:hypothetical protein
MCGRNLRRLGPITARRIITITRHGFLWLRTRREITFEYPQVEDSTRREEKSTKSKIITLR